MPHTSYSEIKLARKCPRAHKYRYGERLARKKPNRPAFIGTILHEMLHAWVLCRIHDIVEKDPWDVLKKYKKQYAKLFKEERELFGDVPATVTAIFEGYLRRWRKDGLKYIASEVPVLTDLTPDIRLVGFIDKIVEDKQGRRFLMDHKFHRTIPGPEDRFADIQTLLYFWGWNRENPPEKQVDGVVWDYGRMKAPTKPELLQRGGLTKRANIDTDVHTYRETIKEHGLKEKDYKDILAKLDGKETTFFERVWLPAPPKGMIEEVVEDARQTVVVQKHLMKAGIAPRNMSKFNCNYCDYRPLCEAEIRQLDADFIRKRDYENRDWPEEGTDEED